MSSQNNDSSVAAGNIFNVNGLVALVTGGGTGIGLMAAKALAQNGAQKVYIAGRRLEVLQAAATSLGPNVTALKCDVTSKTSLEAAVAFVEKDSGYLNLLLCNSGVSGPQIQAPTPETTVEDFASRNFAVGFEAYVDTFAVNTAAVWFTTMAFLGLLAKGNKKGNVTQTSQVVVTSSIASFNKKAPGGWAYGQSKAAATHATKQLSVLLTQWNMRANCVAPGLFPSEMSAILDKVFAGGDPAIPVKPAELVPVQRMGYEKEMAGTMLYLASQAGGYNNGAVIVVDGGRLTMFPSVT